MTTSKSNDGESFGEVSSGQEPSSVTEANQRAAALVCSDLFNDKHKHNTSNACQHLIAALRLIQALPESPMRRSMATAIGDLIESPPLDTARTNLQHRVLFFLNDFKTELATPELRPIGDALRPIANGR